MTPKNNHTYLIEYTPDGRDSSETAYTGPGVYDGEIITTEDGETLYLMKKLRSEQGFTEEGWFSGKDIKAELKYE